MRGFTFLFQTVISALLAFILMLLFAHSSSVAHAERATVNLELPKYNGISYTYEDLNDLAKNIYYEARGEPTVGQVAVAYVVLNRMKDKDFPSTVHEVIYQKCQFSWVCQKAYPVRDQVAWNKALSIAEGCLRHEISDPTDGSLYFHAQSIKMTSRDVNQIHINSHIFYNMKAVANVTRGKSITLAKNGSASIY